MGRKYLSGLCCILRRPFIVLLFIVASKTMGNEAGANANLIANPGFENEPPGDAGPPLPWHAREPGFIIDEHVFHSGECSLFFEGAGSANANLSTDLKIAPGKDYCFSFWSRSLRTNAALSATYDWGRIERRHTYTSRQFSFGPEWTYYSFKLRMPPGAAALNLRLRIPSGVWLDDLSFRENPPTADLSGGRMSAIFSPPVFYKYVVEYPDYSMECVCHQDGFKRLMVYFKDRTLYQSGGLSMNLGGGKSFDANKLPLIVNEEDNPGRKKISWSSTVSEEMDYRGEIIGTAGKIVYSQQWVYKKNCPGVELGSSIPLDARLMEKAQYLLCFADGRVKRGIIHDLEEKFSVLEDGEGSYVTEAVFWTTAGIIKYRLILTGIMAEDGRMTTPPKGHGVGVGIGCNLRVGGKAGEKRGITFEMEVEP